MAVVKLAVNIVIYESNIAKFHGEVYQAFDKGNVALGHKYYDEMEAVKWEWTNPTTRHDGTEVYTPRNIIDTSALAASYNGFRFPNTKRYFHTWQEDYALEVHEGQTYVNEDGSTTHKPARPFTRDVDFEWVI